MDNVIKGDGLFGQNNNDDGKLKKGVLYEMPKQDRKNKPRIEEAPTAEQIKEMRDLSQEMKKYYKELKVIETRGRDSEKAWAFVAKKITTEKLLVVARQKEKWPLSPEKFRMVAEELKKRISSKIENVDDDPNDAA